MPGHELAQELLLAAKSDLKALAHMLNQDIFDDRVFGFHAQQAVEKALKSWISHLGYTHPFTHDLSLLMHTLESYGESVNDYWELLDLSGYAVRFRYEMLPEGDEPLNRDHLLEDVQNLIKNIEKRLDNISI